MPISTNLDYPYEFFSHLLRLVLMLLMTLFRLACEGDGDPACVCVCVWFCTASQVKYLTEVLKMSQMSNNNNVLYPYESN